MFRRASLALTRSWIIDRSNSANTPIIPNIARSLSGLVFMLSFHFLVRHSLALSLLGGSGGMGESTRCEGGGEAQVKTVRIAVLGEDQAAAFGVYAALLLKELTNRVLRSVTLRQYTP